MLKAKNINYMKKKDLENMQQQFRSGSDMTSFATNLQRKQYNVRYTTNTENRITAAFFIRDSAIKELRKLPESVVVDATHKSNCHLFTFINSVIARTVASKERPQELATIPITAALTRRKTNSNYE
ncbi:hypothetical protein A0J61_08053 [Choanephora cucurbitarum]|uniref:MULE transposase domain-containing protein n=1 Tax=Choanephora cucurbitarum TaxID=101091 RepID=A0A1C7N4E1_9FUNG|nr:hypothetical protein A0J61_08053 [Choanephora cucurbitarum]